MNYCNTLISVDVQPCNENVPNNPMKEIHIHFNGEVFVNGAKYGNVCASGSDYIEVIRESNNPYINGLKQVLHFTNNRQLLNTTHV